MKKKLTQSYLKECLTYDPDTGIFIWNTRPLSHFKNSKGMNITNAVFANSICGAYDKYGYINIGINGVSYKSHRLAFLYMEGYLPENNIDHIDRDKSNNRFSNLREVSQRCNAQNCKLSKNNKSGVNGVSMDNRKGRWMPCISIERKTIHLGSFKKLDDAVMARYQAELNNPKWTCSTESTAYLYLKERNLI